MEGLEIDAAGARSVVRLTHFSGELATLLKEHLAGYCFGAEIATDPEYYSFKNTVAELLKRYDEKSATGKTGIAGELLAHVVMTQTHPEFTPSSPFFNKEERAIRKGFDSIYIVVGDDPSQAQLWYGEVKSSASLKSTSTTLAASLLDSAAADLHTKLSGDYRRSLWDSAIVDAKITLDSETYSSVGELLRSQSTMAANGGVFEKRIIAIAGVFRKVGDDNVVIDDLVDHEERYLMPYGFVGVALLVIQQDAIDGLVEFLRQEATLDED